MKNKIKLTKKINSNSIKIDGLEKYKGCSAEIIIMIETPEKKSDNKSLLKALNIIKKHSGKIQKWTREELYGR